LGRRFMMNAGSGKGIFRLGARITLSGKFFSFLSRGKPIAASFANQIPNSTCWRKGDAGGRI
jgi:hypothetical protein